MREGVELLSVFFITIILQKSLGKRESPDINCSYYVKYVQSNNPNCKFASQNIYSRAD